MFPVMFDYFLYGLAVRGHGNRIHFKQVFPCLQRAFGIIKVMHEYNPFVESGNFMFRVSFYGPIKRLHRFLRFSRASVNYTQVR